MAENKKAFDILNAVNVNEHTETKDTGKVKLTYLSWAWAWSEVKKRFPDASYEIIKFNGLPYVYDEKTGYMVYTTVTIDGITHEMWLPVMDGNNRAMMAEPYQVKFKNGTAVTVQQATMFDVNKAIMRCLTKNLAMFGLGLYIYAGEDLPEASDEVISQPAKKETAKKAENNSSSSDLERARASYKSLIDYCANEPHKHDINDVAKIFKLNSKSKAEEFDMALNELRKADESTGGQ